MLQTSPLAALAAGVYLGSLDPEAIRVDLYAEATDGGEPERHVMTRGRTLDRRASDQNVYWSAPYKKSLSRDGPVFRMNSPVKKWL